VTGVRRGVTDVLIANAEVDGRLVDVRVTDGAVTAIGNGLPRMDVDDVVEADAGALLPGLSDHHMHLFAAAAAARSVHVGPPHVTSADALRTAIDNDEATVVRAIGYHEGVAGPLDRATLDAITGERPVRILHRSGALWVFNSAALTAYGITDCPDGLLWRDDPRLERVSAREPEPDLAAYADELAAYGILGLTEATPNLDVRALRALDQAVLPQQVLALGAPDNWNPQARDVRVGPRKILLADESDVDWPAFVEQVRVVHAGGRAVAVHSVTRVSLVAAVTGLAAAGPLPGDRVEHAAVVPTDMVDEIQRLGVVVVTQPGMAAERGDAYLAECDADDIEHLWPYASLLAAGVPTAPSSDAPFGPADPWQIMRSARDRRTPDGRHLTAHEAVPVDVALAGFLSPLDQPGGPARGVVSGATADLVLMAAPLAAVLADPCCDAVRMVLTPR
jgi:predicted amidohydrolase YtcJ